MQNVNSGFNCSLHGSSCTIYSSTSTWKTYRTASFICLHIWPLHVQNIQNWLCLAVNQFLKTTELCHILIKCNFGGMSIVLHKTKCELSRPITTAPLPQAHTLTLILNEQISKSIVLTQQGRELHNIILHTKTNHSARWITLWNLLKFTYMNVQHRAKQNPGNIGCMQCVKV